MLGSLAFTLAHRLRGSRSLQLLREMRGEPWHPPEVVRTRQLERVRALLAHAERTVPYYRETFRALGVRSGDIRSFEDFARLPVLTKDILRERREELISESADRAALYVQHSGGSTGVPVSFFRDRPYLDASDAGTYRNLEQSGWRPGEMVAFVWGFNERLDRMRPLEFRARQQLRRFYQFDPFKSGPAELAAWAPAWRRLRPAVALGYASTIGRFAEHLLATGEPAPRLKGVFTTAEKLYPAQREAIGRAFGCHVYDLYGSSEVQNIAAECPQGRMHVNTDFCVLEVDGDAPAAGSRSCGWRSRACRTTSCCRAAAWCTASSSPT
jgi:phenylacetate-CoA ligase